MCVTSARKAVDTVSSHIIFCEYHDRSTETAWRLFLWLRNVRYLSS